MSYKVIRNGKGLDLFPRDTDIACCFCGMTHTWHITESPKPGALVRIQMTANKRATSGIRRGKAVRARIEALAFSFIKRIRK